MTHKQVIVVRKDLGMRTGKIVAQGAHASLGAILAWGREHVAQPEDQLSIPLDDYTKPWLEDCFKKICVYVKSEQELLDVFAHATRLDIPRSLIRDNGLTEFHGVQTYTTVAVGPAAEEIIDQITKHLPLL